MKIFIIFLIFFFKISYCLADIKITYIDINYILTNSLVGQSIENHLNKIEDEYKKTFNEQEKILSDKEKKILAQKNILEKKKFEHELKLLDKEISIYNIDRKKKLNELNKKKINYSKEVLRNLNPIIKNYVEKNSVSIVLPKKNIIVGKKDLDITVDILNLLNNKIKEIKF